MIINEKILSGISLSNDIKSCIKLNVEKLFSIHKITPALAVINIGNDVASQIYVKNKERSARECGIKFFHFSLNENIEEEKIVELILNLNKNPEIHGILVQLPLPKHINIVNIINSIEPKKDVDCFTNFNLGKLFSGHFDLNKDLVPCTAKACVLLIKKALGNNLSGKKVCIVGRSSIVGKPLIPILLNENCTIKILHSKTKNLKEETLWADIIISATGKASLITKNMIANNATVIDVGINRLNNKICGDVDFLNVIENVSYITPVPGGVGPMTIACLLSNVYNACIESIEF